MKKALLLTALTTFLCVGLPWFLVGKPRQGAVVSHTEPPTESTPAEKAALADEQVFLSVILPDGNTETMTLGRYLLGAVMGELPPDFPQEAQKAQAVVCRTYALRQRQGGKHEEGDICTDSSCCQAWKDPDTFSEQKRLPAQKAVLATDGKVLTYEGRLIDATFFSGSGGRTEAAVAVWGTDVPYLQAVDSLGENAPYDGEVLTFPEEELRLLLESARPGLKLPESPEAWFGVPVQTPGGGVDHMEIGGEVFTGKELRRLLGLRSTVFTVLAEDGGVSFHTRGFGHRVGMSQYGARAMALRGSNWEEILRYYYKGVQVEDLAPESQTETPLQQNHPQNHGFLQGCSG